MMHDFHYSVPMISTYVYGNSLLFITLKAVSHAAQYYDKQLAPTE